MKSKLILTATVLSAMAGGCISYATDFPTSDTTVSMDTEYVTNNSVNGSVTVTGNGKNTLNIKNGIKDNNVLCSTSGQVTIKNFKDITINSGNSGNAGDGLHADLNGGIVISDVDTINIGSADNRFESSGQAIHGLYGQVKLDVGSLNVYTALEGIMAQKIEGNPAVDIHTARDVTIDSNRVSVMAGAINDRAGTAEIKIDAGGKVTLKSATRSAIQGFDISGGPTTYEGKGDVKISINGRQGIDLISPDNTAAVYLGRENKGDTKLDITSDEGDVNITGGNGFNLKGAAAGTMTAFVTGQNVHIASTAGAGIALDNSALALKVNQPGGAITVDTPNGDGTAVKVSGSKGSLTFGDGKTNTDVYVNGYVQVTDKANVTFAGNTTTHVDSKYLTQDKAFITTGNGSGTVNLNGKLDIGNVATGTELNFSDSEALNQAAAEAIQTNNVLQNITMDGNQMKVGMVDKKEVGTLLKGASLANTAYEATQTNAGGFADLLTGENDVEALNSAAGLSAMAGVEHGTYTAAGIFNDAVAGHLMNRNDEDVWAYGFHNKENVNGLSFGADYDAQYNGVVAGADLYRNGGTVAGIALSYADGNVSGSNGFASTQNDADYYGASLYARFDRGSYALLGDISYMKGDHDVTQWNKGQQITASPDSDAVSVGVKAVKDFTAGESGTLTPYIGVRYLRLSTDGFTAYNASYSGDDQDLVLIPVGVNYSAAITGGSWTFRPYAGVGYIWNAGDKSADQTVTLGTAADSFSYDTVDSGSFLTRVGFVADHGDMSYGVGYSYQKGDSVSNNAWTLSASFRF